jgi:hypothetical protein
MITAALLAATVVSGLASRQRGSSSSAWCDPLRDAV